MICSHFVSTWQTLCFTGSADDRIVGVVITFVASGEDCCIAEVTFFTLRTLICTTNDSRCSTDSTWSARLSTSIGPRSSWTRKTVRSLPTTERRIVSACGAINRSCGRRRAVPTFRTGQALREFGASCITAVGSIRARNGRSSVCGAVISSGAGGGSDGGPTAIFSSGAVNR